MFKILGYCPQCGPLTPPVPCTPHGQVSTQILSVFKILGYCPQFGGLFERGLTLRQHLELYGRLKGIPEPLLAGHCTRTIGEFGLSEHESKWVSKLSGGTKRKLMAAIALACEPKVRPPLPTACSRRRFTPPLHALHTPHPT